MTFGRPATLTADTGRAIDVCCAVTVVIELTIPAMLCILTAPIEGAAELLATGMTIGLLPTLLADVIDKEEPGRDFADTCCSEPGS